VRLSVITDEVSSDAETAIELAGELGFDAVELRGVERWRYPDAPRYWLDRVPRLVKESGLSVSAISPGLFTQPFPPLPPPNVGVLRWEDVIAFEQHESAAASIERDIEIVLPAAIAAARELGAHTIICFAFARPPGAPRAHTPFGVVELLRRAAAKVGEEGLQLVAEVRVNSWGDSAADIAAIAQAVNHPSFGINWDPANAYCGGDDRPYPDGYRTVGPWVRHVHFKDAVSEPDGSRHYALEGAIDWQGQIEALVADNYQGYISIETHLRPKLANVRRATERLRRLVASIEGSPVDPAGRS